MSWVHEHRFPDSLALAHALSGEIKVDLEEAIAARGQASLVVSGGRTPARLFEQLRGEALDWSKVWVTLADERWVETNSPASNEKMVRETLLTGPAAAAHFVGLKNPAPAPEAGADWATRALTRVPHPFDVVLLGMGTDGHFASLFPGLPETKAGLDLHNPALCVAVDKQQNGYARMSLTISALLHSRLILVAISGRPKRTVALQALAGTGGTPIATLLSHRKDDLEFLWTE